MPEISFLENLLEFDIVDLSFKKQDGSYTGH